MEPHLLKLRSSIKPSLMRMTLMRGTFLAALGAVIILYGATYMSVHILNILGFPLLLLAVVLIAIGLIPYRRLSRLAEVPNELLVENNFRLFYSTGGKQTFILPFPSIDKINYLQQGNMYGIAVWLRKPIPKQIAVTDPSFDMEKFQANSQEKYHCDLFFPYFSQHAYNELIDYLNFEE